MIGRLCDLSHDLQLQSLMPDKELVPVAGFLDVDIVAESNVVRECVNEEGSQLRIRSRMSPAVVDLSTAKLSEIERIPKTVQRIS